jgi:hypothetical protein
MHNVTANSLRLLALTFAGAAAAACSGNTKSNAQQTSNGNVDTAVVREAAYVTAEGPAVQVTRTDSKSVEKATEYKLTSDNFTHFLAAADSLSALRARDAATDKFLSQNLTDAGSTDTDAGLKWLESNAPVSNAINSAGISTRDYFVQAIAIASAERFMSDPSAAPPTPTAKDNAEFLRSRQADLDHLKRLRANRPDVVVKP